MSDPIQFAKWFVLDSPGHGGVAYSARAKYFKPTVRPSDFPTRVYRTASLQMGKVGVREELLNAS